MLPSKGKFMVLRALEINKDQDYENSTIEVFRNLQNTEDVDRKDRANEDYGEPPSPKVISESTDVGTKEQFGLARMNHREREGTDRLIEFQKALFVILKTSKIKSEVKSNPRIPIVNGPGVDDQTGILGAQD
ncbi:hypothetical protein FQA39_LY04571 [Lamprigera yunnana]|nr:hypothetical protein FQA39_LY04571 [Lamprigera yunnana]